jgi:hypothetical protein
LWPAGEDGGGRRTGRLNGPRPTSGAAGGIDDGDDALADMVLAARDVGAPIHGGLQAVAR